MSNLQTGSFILPPPVSPTSPEISTSQQMAAAPKSPTLSSKTQASVQWYDRAPQPQRSMGSNSPLEMSAVDLKWGVLFDKQGLPTKRWQEVIGGLGRYLVS